jgi:hypothetical protein
MILRFSSYSNTVEGPQWAISPYGPRVVTISRG